MIETRTKAEEFFDLVGNSVENLVKLTDLEFVIIMGRIKNNPGRQREFKIKMNPLTSKERMILGELIYHNLTCGKCLMWWSRAWWIPKHNQEGSTTS